MHKKTSSISVRRFVNYAMQWNRKGFNSTKVIIKMIVASFLSKKKKIIKKANKNFMTYILPITSNAYSGNLHI